MYYETQTIYIHTHTHKLPFTQSLSHSLTHTHEGSERAAFSHSQVTITSQTETHETTKPPTYTTTRDKQQTHVFHAIKASAPKLKDRRVGWNRTHTLIDRSVAYFTGT